MNEGKKENTIAWENTKQNENCGGGKWKKIRQAAFSLSLSLCMYSSHERHSFLPPLD